MAYRNRKPLKQSDVDTDSDNDVEGSDDEIEKGIKKMDLRSSCKEEKSRCTIKPYKVSKKTKKGYALFFFNEKFPEGMAYLKSGTQPDELKELFEKIGFSVRIFRNFSVQSMESRILKYAERKNSCFVCFISSHGSNGKVYDRRGHGIDLEKLYKAANDHLRGIPKCFFICACRTEGEKCRYRAGVVTPDTVLGYASTIGSPSKHSRSGGSVYFKYFIEHLTESLTLPAFRRDPKPELNYTRDIHHIMAKVNVDMKKHTEMVPMYSSTLSGLLYLRSDM